MYRSGKRKSPSSYSNKPFKKPRQIVPSARPRYYRVSGRSAGALVAAPEKKYFDSVRSTAYISTVWTGGEQDPVTLNTIFAPTQGTGIANRVGRKVTVQKLKIRGLLTFDAINNAGSIRPFPVARIIVYQDMQTNGTQSQAEQVITDSGSDSQAKLLNFQNPDNFGRFRVLKDKTYSYRDAVVSNDNAATTISQDFSNIPFKFNLSFKKPLFVHFNATNGGTVADIVDNSFHVIVMATDDSAQVTYQARTVFVDA